MSADYVLQLGRVGRTYEGRRVLDVILSRALAGFAEVNRTAFELGEGAVREVNTR